MSATDVVQVGRKLIDKSKTSDPRAMFFNFERHAFRPPSLGPRSNTTPEQVVLKFVMDVRDRIFLALHTTELYTAAIVTVSSMLPHRCQCSVEILHNNAGIQPKYLRKQNLCFIYQS
jgi:hypothetical protein